MAASTNGTGGVETEPLLRSRNNSSQPAYDASPDDDDSLMRGEEDGKRQLGLVSASFLIFNRVIGTGIFATPSVILRASGSVGMSLVMWVLGATVAACGTAVYIELGTGLPRNGGEKVYLEYIYRNPKFLASSVYAMYAVFIAWQSASATVFGEYVVHALNPTNGSFPISSRFVSLICMTFAFVIHGTRLQWGLRIQNALATFKLLILVGMAFSGLAVLSGLIELKEPPDNFKWPVMWKGSGSGGVNAFVTGLYNIIWSFIGYSNANYALSEIRNPVRTIRIAAPSAMLLVTLMYFLVNIAYYAVVDKEEILGSGRIAAALFFGKLWGIRAEQFVSVIIACSAMGNVLAVLFTQSRVIQELGRQGVLPFSSFFASNKPFNTPLGGLFAQWLITSFIIAAVPSGDAYHFMLNMSSYPLSLINMFVSVGLLLLHTPFLKYEWDPPFRAYRVATVFFFLSNVFLVFAPLIPPADGFRPYEWLPYWLHVLVASSISLVGISYWYMRFRWLPTRGGYRYVQEQIVEDDGTTRNVIRKVVAI
ncbi:amino acid transporter [Cristinia sonorae]|uniref:Amino acid transporter n=1 Tax=Cristinia sonorae TaxID=1940300 RepID=A0A8K0UKX8_9AGAR|nr:amino acid transporter [Cristinia sonorae]